MKKLGIVLSTLSLAACGHAGGLIPDAAALPSSDVVAPRFSRFSPQNVTAVTGRVVRLVGPLSAAVVGTKIPAASAGPKAGAGIGGVTVYLSTYNVWNILTPGVKALAVTHTASDGSFSLPVPAGNSSPLFYLTAVAGNLVGSSGVTSRGYTVGRESVATIPNYDPWAQPIPATVYLDQLTADERIAISSFNAMHLANHPAFADTGDEMVARAMSAYTNSHRCPSNSASDQAELTKVIQRLGDNAGGNTTAINGWGLPSWTWSTALAKYPVINGSFVAIGAHAIYHGNPCPKLVPGWGAGIGKPHPYFELVQHTI